MRKIYTLAYADDVAIMAENEKQIKIDVAIREIFEKKLEINTSKPN